MTYSPDMKFSIREFISLLLIERRGVIQIFIFLPKISGTIDRPERFVYN